MPIDPVEWLATAQQLVNASAPSEVELRRAVSAAYYAVFHLLLKTATERFLGTNMDSSYQALYRSFQHPKMKELCKLLDVTKLNQRYTNALGFENPSANVREFARGFVQLQERRHRADYDPVRVLTYR